MGVKRLNHAVLYVRDADRAAAFYEEALGFRVVSRMPGRAAFLRAAETDNHHDLGLFSVGADAPPPQPGRVGLYHLAWQVETIEDLAATASRLRAMGALVGASDHGVSKSLYGKDVDGNEFEVMFEVPRSAWTPELESAAVVAPLDLEAELAAWGSEAGAANH